MWLAMELGLEGYGGWSQSMGNLGVSLFDLGNSHGVQTVTMTAMGAANTT